MAGCNSPPDPATVPTVEPEEEAALEFKKVEASETGKILAGNDVALNGNHHILAMPRDESRSNGGGKPPGDGEVGAGGGEGGSGDAAERPAPQQHEELDGGWGWVVCLGSFVIHHNVLGLQYSFGVLFKALMDDPEMSETSSHSGSASVGVMSTTLMLGCAIFVGPLVTRYGGRPVTLAGAILIAMGLFTASYARSVLHLYFTYSLLSGVGFSLMFAPCVMIVSLWFSRRRTLAVGMSVAGSGIGTLVIAQISERLIDAFGWRGALVYLSVGTGIANVVSALTFYSPETSKSTSKSTSTSTSTSSTKKHQDDGKTLLDDDSCAVNSTEMVEVRLHGGDAHVNAEDDCASSAAGQEKNAGEERGGQGGQGVRTRNGEEDIEKAEGNEVVGREKALTMRELGQHPSFVPLMWLSFFFAGFMWVPYIYLPAFQFDALGTPLKQGAQTVASIGIFSTFGRIVIGRIAMYYSVLKCLHACCFISGAAVCLLALVPSAPFLIWVFAMAFGLSAGSVIALFGPVIIDLVGIQNLPNGYGFLCTVQAPGVLAIPAVCGMLHDAFGSYIAIWVVSGLGMMASSMFLFMVKQPTTAPPHGQA